MATKLCSYCQAPTTCRCSGCKTHFYCNVDHQKEDWKKHRPIYKELQLEAQLTQAASILQHAWLTLQEWTQLTPITAVKINSGQVVVHEGVKAQGNLFVPFPNHMVHDQHAKSTILCYLQGVESLAFMQPLVKQLVDRKYIVISHVCYQTTLI
jgi:hypothetical protein